ncbi:hypothetical protein SAMN05421874_1612 [Nonomuraea maritima]|uniref:NACHT domain-containing protein n=1 Tax=Nonomuraea maritima TaxID=683260 RepID=A0A1G9SLK5_9ACTN|nr:hypothetical protein SAMN05421874_1612 [Nonomuraea maritima]
MVLLGEPGGGKTTVLRQLIHELPLADDVGPYAEDHHLWVNGYDLTEYSYEEFLGRFLAALAGQLGGPRTAASDAQEAAPARAGRLTVVIDQLDESPISRLLPERLNRSLKGRDPASLRLLIACRTADYPPHMTDILSKHFGACPLADLAPLARTDAVQLANSADVDGESLIAAAIAAQAGALASVPLTLGLLVALYKDNGTLTGTPRELFEEGTRLLVQEHSVARTVATTASPAQHLIVAGRIAARMLLAGRRTLWLGPISVSRKHDLDLDLATIAGGYEETAPGQSFAVTENIVKEVLRTGLFTTYGDSRVLFRHSSISAFLAADYIVRRKVDENRLASLFLIKTPDDENYIIPTPLRETAAWLVALDPDHASWLASADAESLAVHSALVQSDQIRELIVSRMLERAGDVELGDVSWYYRHWNLGHPSLPRQLAAVLEVDPGDVVADWDQYARVRVALRLAQECPDPELSTLLLDIVQDNRWPYPERRLAMTAAFASAPDICATSLRQLLAELDDVEYAAAADPNDELRGTALSLLWPDYVDVNSLLDWITFPQNEKMIGVYSRFLRTMADSCSDSDIYEVLRWLRDVYEVEPISRAARVSATGELEEVQRRRSARVDTEMFSRGNSAEQLLDSIINRALMAPNADKCMSLMADIIVRRLRQYERMHMPRALDETSEAGLAREKSTSLRRALMDALVRASAGLGEHKRHMAWLIVNEWTRDPKFSWRTSSSEVSGRSTLADSSDFEWALNQANAAADAGEVEVADLYGLVASYLFNGEDRHLFELAYNHQQNPAWPHIQWFYSGIDINGDLAKAWRRNYETSRRLEWPESASFVLGLRNKLQQAKEGNTESFWRLLYHLQVDPKTGEGREHFDDDFLSWPGAAVFDSGDRADIVASALYYLEHENDHGSAWLGQPILDRRAWAGYLALSLLFREGKIEKLSPRVWAKWTAAVLDIRLSSPGEAGNGIKNALLKEAALKAPKEFARDADRQIRGEAARGEPTWDLQLLNPSWSAELFVTLECLACDLNRALLSSALIGESAELRCSCCHSHEVGDLLELPNTPEARTATVRVLSDLLGVLANNGSMFVSAAAEDVLGYVNANRLSNWSLAVLVARVLLWSDASKGWERVKALVLSNPDFGRELSEACAASDVKQRLEASLTVNQLESLYLWLNSLYPQDDLVLESGASWGRSDSEAAKWRDGVANAIARRCTAEALASLGKLAACFPTRLALRSSLVKARVSYAEAGALRPSYEVIVATLESPSDGRAIHAYSGDHIDFRGSTFYGPVAGKQMGVSTPCSDGSPGQLD